MSEPAPSVRRVLAMLAAFPVDKRPVSDLTPDAARMRTRRIWAEYWNALPPQIASVSDHAVATPAGPVPVRLYDPDSDLTRPILFFHGGGFVVGDLDTHDGIARKLALYSGRPVISVDYRRAPEHSYPAPLEDCTAVAHKVSDGTAGLGLDGRRFALAGDSAGANLALGVALRLRGLGIHPRAGFLAFGNYDPAQSGASHTRYASGYGLTAHDVGWFWRQYLGDRIMDAPVDAAPLAADLRGLPPFFVTAAECDPLSDDSIALVERFGAQGVSCLFRLWRGMIHGCIGMGRELNAADAQLADAATWLAHALNASPFESTNGDR